MRCARKAKQMEKICGSFYGDELMHAGLITTDTSAGDLLPGLNQGLHLGRDFDSRIFVLE